jgi:hypothetical protein
MDPGAFRHIQLTLLIDCSQPTGPYINTMDCKFNCTALNNPWSLHPTDFREQTNKKQKLTLFNHYKKSGHVKHHSTKTTQHYNDYARTYHGKLLVCPKKAKHPLHHG